MIFLTVGSQNFQFNRLLQAADQLNIAEEIFAQIGYSGYEPKHYKYKRFLNKNEFEEAMNKADIIIAHGGTGTIISAIKKRKKIIAVPRLSKYGEHVDDHQLQLVCLFNESKFIYSCTDMDLEKAISTVRNTEYNIYQSNTINIIKDLDQYIESIFDAEN